MWREVGDLPKNFGFYDVQVTSAGFDPTFIDEDPGTFHARSFDGIDRALWVPQLTETKTLVLGSSQAAESVEEDSLKRSGIALATRRSGGGAVLVSAADLVWFDVVLGATDPLWHHDVGRSFDWLGGACQRALGSLRVDTEQHHGRLTTTEWSRRICFAGLGPGELTVNGKKLVGMSQRRTRTASRLQVAILRRWDGAEHASFLALGDSDRERAATELAEAATGIPHSPETILEAVVNELADL